MTDKYGEIYEGEGGIQGLKGVGQYGDVYGGPIRCLSSVIL